jgi:hypothetical protein
MYHYVNWNMYLRVYMDLHIASASGDIAGCPRFACAAALGGSEESPCYNRSFGDNFIQSAHVSEARGVGGLIRHLNYAWVCPDAGSAKAV